LKILDCYYSSTFVDFWGRKRSWNLPLDLVKKFSLFWLCLYLLLQNCDNSYTLQGGEGDCFYVVGSGEFEVLATQVYKLCHLIAVLICDGSTDIHLGKY